MHCALGHHCRRGERDPELWNVAADFAINPILLGNGFVLPAGAPVDPTFNNLSAEEIYARLLQRGSKENGGTKPKQQQTNAGGGTTTGAEGGDGIAPPNPKPDASPQPVLEEGGRTTDDAVGPTSIRPGGSARSGTRRTTTGKLLRLPRNVARSMNGALPLSRPFGPPRRGDTNPQASKGLLAKAANPHRIGARFCAILWPLLPQRITAGLHPTAATSLRACTSPPSNAEGWARS